MNIKGIKHIVEYCDKANIVPLIRGRHGIGKSEATVQYAKSNNMHCETLILSLMDTGDLLGIPNVKNIGGSISTVWAAPSWYQTIVDRAYPAVMQVKDLVFKDKDFNEYFNTKFEDTLIGREELNDIYCDYTNLPKDVLQILTQNLVSYAKAIRSVLFLDEFNRAPVDILNASLQLILDKRLHNHILPVVDGKPTLVVAAINPDDQEYTVNGFDPALLDRFMVVDVEQDSSEWLDYANSNGISRVVVDFIAEHPDRLHYTPSNGERGATPRSWTKLSSLLTNVKNIKEEYLFAVVKGLVDSEVGSQFINFYNNYKTVIRYEDIDKRIKTLLKTNKNNVVKASKVLKEEITDKQESIRQTEIVKQFYKNYMGKEQLEALPLLVYMYSMQLEQATAFLISTKEQDPSLLKFGELDSYTNKALVLAITKSGMSKEKETKNG